MSWRRQIETLLVVEGLKLNILFNAKNKNGTIRNQRLSALKIVFTAMEQDVAREHMLGEDISLITLWSDLETEYGPSSAKIKEYFNSV